MLFIARVDVDNQKLIKCDLISIEFLNILYTYTFKHFIHLNILFTYKFITFIYL